MADCRHVIERNQVRGCFGATSDADFKRRDRAGSVRQPLARGLMNIISVFSSRKSMTQKLLQNEPVDDLTVRSMISNGGMGFIAFCIALLLTLFLIGISIQACCWSFCGRPCLWKHPWRRHRTNKIVTIILYSLLALLFLLTYCGALYYSSWAKKDIDSVSCSVDHVVNDAFFTGFTTKDKQFVPGVVDVRDLCLATSQAAASTFPPSAKMPTHGVFIKRALASAFAPVLFTDSMLRTRTFQGWGTKQEIESAADSTDPFELNFGLTHASKIGESLETTYGPFFGALERLPDMKHSDANTYKNIREVSDGLKTLSSDIDKLTDKIVPHYNTMTEKYNTLKDHKAYKKATAVIPPTAITLTVITALWLLGATILFIYYLTSEQYANPINSSEPKRFMTYFAGFLTFSGLVWSIILLLIAASIMIAVYPVADGCRVISKYKTDRQFFSKYPRVASGVNTSYIDVCVYGDHGGRLSGLHKGLGGQDIDKAQKIKIPIEKLAGLKFAIPAENLASLRSAVDKAKDMFIIPTNVLDGGANAKDESCFSPDSIDRNCANVEGGCSTFDDWCKESILGAPALAGLVEKKFQKPVCLRGTPCNADSVPVDESTVCQEAVCVRGRLWDLEKEIPGLSTTENEARKMLQRDNELKTLLDIGARLSMLRTQLKRSVNSGQLPEAVATPGWNAVTFSDPCPPGNACNIFFKLANRQNISDGYTLVDYDTWKESWYDDTKAAIDQMDTPEKILTHISLVATQQTSFSGKTGLEWSVRLD